MGERKESILRAADRGLPATPWLWPDPIRAL